MASSLLSLIAPKDRADAAAVLAEDPTLAAWAELHEESGWSTFRPRPDRPELFDQQWSFVFNQDAVAWFLKGNAAGGTTAGAYKTARFVLNLQPPPRKDTPFWIISNTYEQTCGACWCEKLLGEGHLPSCEVEWDRVRWLDVKAGYPKAVPLKPWPGRPGKNWVLEFKSFDQGRENMQARSIGGFWFSEQFPEAIFTEVLRGVRDTMYAGGQFCEFTPIEPALCIWLERLLDNPPPGWAFYRGNTECNRVNLAGGWYEQFFGAVPDEMRSTRQTGALACYEGVIYPSFSSAHVVGDEVIVFPPNVRHFRGVDWGSSEEHPQTCVWGYVDGTGDWFIYDEYWSNEQDKILVDHAVEILARSIYWGWLPPPQCTQAAYAENDPLVAVVITAVEARLEELAPETAWREKPPEEATPRARRRPRPNDSDDRDAKGRFLWLARHRGSSTYGYTYCDPARPGEITAFARYGLQPAPASNDVFQGIDYVRTLLKIQPASGKPRVFIHKRCEHLIQEMRKYRWKPQPKTTGLVQHAAPPPVPLKKDDDTVDAFRYMVFSQSRETGKTASVASYSDYQKQRESVQLHRHAGPRKWLRG